MNCKNAISVSKDKILLKIHVVPGSSKSVFPAGYNRWRNSIEIKVKAEAKQDKANKELIGKIAEYFNISSKDVTIVTGQKNRVKTVAIKNIQKDDVYCKIQESLNGL
jgi:uncharacterized protein (TIGR00251 family)